VSDRVGTRRAGVGQYLRRNAEPVRFERILDRFLRSIVSDEPRSTAARFRGEQASVVNFAVTHASAGRPDDHELGRRCLRGRASLAQREGRPGGNAVSSQASGICPAVLHRVWETSNRSTGVTQSLASISDRTLDSAFGPSGEITPTPVTSTRSDRTTSCIMHIYTFSHL